tara:strand:- start:1982 stop:2329 length:348 start_codon:yes stop_codon:yes gene_type:complete
MSRISEIAENVTSMKDADELMMELMEACNDTVTPIPDAGKFYFFVYNPKTPDIQYDQNPLVAVTEVFQWGFRGINFHWGEHRQYTWMEVVGQLYEVYDDELNDLDAIPFAKFRYK